MQPFWLDMTCEFGNWDAVFSYDEAGEIRGAWAFHHGTRFGMRWIRLPILTPFTALWIEARADLSKYKQMVHRHEVLGDLEKQLPRMHVFEIKLPWIMTDWLSLYWQGYHQETRYTFRFEEIDMQKIEAATSKSFRRNLRTAERHFTIDEGTVSDLYMMMENVFEMRDARVVFSQNTLAHIVTTLRQKDQCHLYAARDADGVQAILLVVWDDRTMYYLIGGRRHTDSKHGTDLLLWQAIGDAGRRGLAFDFEGSMIRGVNQFFQKFGADLTPYFYIYKYRGLARLKYLR